MESISQNRILREKLSAAEEWLNCENEPPYVVTVTEGFSVHVKGLNRSFGGVVRTYRWDLLYISMPQSLDSLIRTWKNDDSALIRQAALQLEKLREGNTPK